MSFFLQRTLQLTILLASVIILRAMFGKSAKRVFVLMWSSAFVAAIIPFNIGINYAALKTEWRMQTLRAANTALALQDDGVHNAVNSTGATQVYEPVSLVLILWLFGTAIFVIYYFVSWALLRKKIMTHSAALAIDAFDKRFHLKFRKVRMKMMDSVESPFSFGLFFPTVVVPKDFNTWGSAEKEFVVLHEMTHIRRLDLFPKIIATWSCCLYWYNPLVWVAKEQLNRDIEMACDEFVVQGKGKTITKQYAAMLIDTIGCKTHSFLRNSFGRYGITERIRNLAYGAGAGYVRAAAVCILSIFLSGFYLEVTPEGPIQLLGRSAVISRPETEPDDAKIKGSILMCGRAGYKAIDEGSVLVFEDAFGGMQCKEGEWLTGTFCFTVPTPASELVKIAVYSEASGKVILVYNGAASDNVRFAMKAEEPFSTYRVVLISCVSDPITMETVQIAKRSDAK